MIYIIPICGHCTQILFIHLLSVIARTDDNEEKGINFILKPVNKVRYRLNFLATMI